MSPNPLSRRIRALEQWLGAELTDRTSYPDQADQAGEQFRRPRAEIVRQAIDARAMRAACKARRPTPSCLPRHTLSLDVFPTWLHALEKKLWLGQGQLLAANARRSDEPGEGNWRPAALLSPHQPAGAAGRDRATRWWCSALRPSRRSRGPTAGAAHCSRCRGSDHKKIPVSLHAAVFIFGRMVELILQQSPLRASRDVYENDMSEALKAMALEGHGLAWLPEIWSPRAESQAHRPLRRQPLDRHDGNSPVSSTAPSAKWRTPCGRLRWASDERWRSGLNRYWQSRTTKRVWVTGAGMSSFVRCCSTP